MSEVQIPISLPLDDDSFLRRECPYCHREFKIQIGQEELADTIQAGIDSYLLERPTQRDSQEPTTPSGESASEFTCPYCDQRAPRDDWWTREQLAYVHMFLDNFVARMMNEHLIRPLRRSPGRQASGPISVRFEGRDLPTSEPWISPESNDMTPHDLPCCGRKVKLLDDWEGTFHCCFCGFPHDRSEGRK